MSEMPIVPGPKEARFPLLRHAGPTATSGSYHRRHDRHICHEYFRWATTAYDIGDRLSHVQRSNTTTITYPILIHLLPLSPQPPTTITSTTSTTTSTTTTNNYNYYRITVLLYSLEQKLKVTVSRVRPCLNAATAAHVK